MNLITPAELARVITEKTGEPFTRQAVSKAIADGIIPFVQQGNRKMVDLDERAVKQYISTGNRQREQAKKKDITAPARSEKQQQKQPKPKHPSQDGPDNIGGLTQFEINSRKKYADMRKSELEVERFLKNYLPTEMVKASLFYHIERLHSVLERSAAVFVQEIGASILEAGEVLPAHINRFTDMVLEAMHDNKKAIEKEIKKYEPK